MANSLTYFTVTGAWQDVQNSPPSNVGTTTPTVEDISAYVDFFPGTADDADLIGLQLLVADYETFGDTQLVLDPITGRTLEGTLRSITRTDPEGVGLVANSAFIAAAIGVPLVYHVRFRAVSYANAAQTLSNFAFVAPVDDTPVVLTSTTLERLPYRGP